MKIESAIKLGEKYLKDYLSTLIRCLNSPSTLAVACRNEYEIKKEEEGMSIESYIFILANIGLGSTFSTILPNRPAPKELLIIFIVLMVFWFFLSFITHSLCRIFGGKGKAVNSIETGMRVFSFSYLSSSFLTFIWLACVMAYPVLPEFIGNYVWPTFTFWFSGYGLLFVLQFLFIAVYLPLSMKKVHQFSGVRGNVASSIAPIFAVLLGLPIFLIGGC